MKHLLLLCLLIAGCDAKVKVESKQTYDPPGVIPMVQFHERDLGVHGSLWFCTNDNHRFAIAVTELVSGNAPISICEVTDASLVSKGSMNHISEDAELSVSNWPKISSVIAVIYSNNVPFVVELGRTSSIPQFVRSAYAKVWEQGFITGSTEGMNTMKKVDDAVIGNISSPEFVTNTYIKLLNSQSNLNPYR